MFTPTYSLKRKNDWITLGMLLLLIWAMSTRLVEIMMKMLGEGVIPNSFSYSLALITCGKLEDIEGKWYILNLLCLEWWQNALLTSVDRFSCLVFCFQPYMSYEEPWPWERGSGAGDFNLCLLRLFKNVDGFLSDPPEVMHFCRIQQVCGNFFREPVNTDLNENFPVIPHHKFPF